MGNLLTGSPEEIHVSTSGDKYKRGIFNKFMIFLLELTTQMGFNTQIETM